MTRIFVIAFFLFVLPVVTLAQVTDEFTIRVFGAIDNEAPSTTTIQSIVPVTFSQIDIAWATSTDNFSVFGYVVSRDGVPIATTTALFYSDTGLMASTTYSYSVRTFDGVPNYSSSSATAATTTPDIPVVIPPTTSSTTQGGTAARVIVESITVTADTTSADVAVVTKRPARIEIRIGETSSYEIGYISGTRFARDHSIPVSNLRPNTRYYYEVYGYTLSGAQTFLERGSFETLSGAPLTSPANVAAFSASAQSQDVLLQWQLPISMPKDALVRIVRSYYGYPVSINDGMVIYEGRGEQATDSDVLNQYERMFYTAFVIDPNGRTSSGAIAQVVSGSVQKDLSTSSDQPAPPTKPSFVSNDAVAVGEVGVSTQEVVDLDMPDSGYISIAQLDELFTMATDTVPLSSDAPFTVAVLSKFITGDFKTIVATLGDPRGSEKTFAFLLRLNADQTRYEATIAAVQFGGRSDFIVEIFDYDSLVMARYVTQIEFTPDATVASSTIEVLWWRLATAAWYGLLAVPFLMLFWLWFIYRRREAGDLIR